MGRCWRAWWRLGERERRERGPGGSWWRLGERGRREWVAVWGVWAQEMGALCEGGAGVSPFGGPGLVAQVRAVRRCWRVLGGLAWCRLVLGGGVPRPPWIRHIGVRRRQRLVVRVE